MTVGNPEWELQIGNQEWELEIGNRLTALECLEWYGHFRSSLVITAARDSVLELYHGTVWVSNVLVDPRNVWLHKLHVTGSMVLGRSGSWKSARSWQRIIHYEKSSQCQGRHAHVVTAVGGNRSNSPTFSPLVSRSMEV